LPFPSGAKEKIADAEGLVVETNVKVNVLTSLVKSLNTTPPLAPPSPPPLPAAPPLPAIPPAEPLGVAGVSIGQYNSSMGLLGGGFAALLLLCGPLWLGYKYCTRPKRKQQIARLDSLQALVSEASSEPSGRAARGLGLLKEAVARVVKAGGEGSVTTQSDAFLRTVEAMLEARARLSPGLRAALVDEWARRQKQPALAEAESSPRFTAEAPTEEEQVQLLKSLLEPSAQPAVAPGGVLGLAPLAPGAGGGGGVRAAPPKLLPVRQNAPVPDGVVQAAFAEFERQHGVPAPSEAEALQALRTAVAPYARCFQLSQLSSVPRPKQLGEGLPEQAISAASCFPAKPGPFQARSSINQLKNALVEAIQELEEEARYEPPPAEMGSTLKVKEINQGVFGMGQGGGVRLRPPRLNPVRLEPGAVPEQVVAEARSLFEARYGADAAADASEFDCLQLLKTAVSGSGPSYMTAAAESVVDGSLGGKATLPSLLPPIPSTGQLTGQLQSQQLAPQGTAPSAELLAAAAALADAEADETAEEVAVAADGGGGGEPEPAVQTPRSNAGAVFASEPLAPGPNGGGGVRLAPPKLRAPEEEMASLAEGLDRAIEEAAQQIDEVRANKIDTGLRPAAGWEGGGGVRLVPPQLSAPPSLQPPGIPQPIQTALRADFVLKSGEEAAGTLETEEMAQEVVGGWEEEHQALKQLLIRERESEAARGAKAEAAEAAKTAAARKAAAQTGADAPKVAKGAASASRSPANASTTRARSEPLADGWEGGGGANLPPPLLKPAAFSDENVARRLERQRQVHKSGRALGKAGALRQASFDKGLAGVGFPLTSKFDRDVLTAAHALARDPELLGSLLGPELAVQDRLNSVGHRAGKPDQQPTTSGWRRALSGARRKSHARVAPGGAEDHGALLAEDKASKAWG
jgi:hypothetical protein